MEIKTRRDAAEAGESKYFTGRPCGKGHVEPRYTSNGICCACNREGVKAYSAALNKRKTAKSRGYFVYPLHPNDHAAAWAYCQALDMQRGVVPQAAPNTLTWDDQLAAINEARAERMAALFPPKELPPETFK